MEDNYPKAYKEVIEILKHVPEESINKIPKDIIKMFQSKMDVNYNFQIDGNKNFDELELLDETKAILANIFRDYWATPYQQERIIAKEKYDKQKREELKREKYNPDIFKNRSKKYEAQEEKAKKGDVEDNTNSNLPIEVKKESFYNKMIEFFKNIFHIK